MGRRWGPPAALRVCRAAYARYRYTPVNFYTEDYCINARALSLEETSPRTTDGFLIRNNRANQVNKKATRLNNSIHMWSLTFKDYMVKMKNELPKSFTMRFLYS